MASMLLLACERDGGAWPPVAKLCHALLQSGHDVSVLCDEPIEYAFENARIERIPKGLESTHYIDNVAGAEIAQEIERGTPMESLGNPLVSWATALAPEIEAPIGKLNPDLIVGSMFCLPLAVTLGQRLNVTVVSLNPGPYVGPNPPRDFHDDYPGLNLWWFEQCVLPPILQADHVLHATDQMFDLGYEGLPSNHHYIGPMIWTPPGTAPVEMAEPGMPWVTASVSMVKQDGELDLVEAIVEAAAGLPARLLVTAPDHDTSTLGTIPPNVFLKQFVSHASALENSKLLLSHAGHGAVTRALWMGVPMVLTPWDRDQFAVAYRAEKLGVAQVIPREDLSAERIRQEIESALDNKALQDASLFHHKRLKRTDPPGLAVELLTGFASGRN